MINRNRSIVLEEQPILDARRIHIKRGQIGASGRSQVRWLVGDDVINKIIWRQAVIVIHPVKMAAVFELLEVVETGGVQRPAFGLGQSR